MPSGDVGALPSGRATSTRTSVSENDFSTARRTAVSSSRCCAGTSSSVLARISRVPRGSRRGGRRLGKDERGKAGAVDVVGRVAVDARTEPARVASHRVRRIIEDGARALASDGDPQHDTSILESATLGHQCLDRHLEPPVD